jgi:hypothetical protein
MKKIYYQVYGSINEYPNRYKSYKEYPEDLNLHYLGEIENDYVVIKSYVVKDK